MRDALAFDQLEDTLSVEHGEGETHGATHQTGQPAGFVAEAMEERRGDHVAVALVQPEVFGEDLVSPE